MPLRGQRCLDLRPEYVVQPCILLWRIAVLLFLESEGDVVSEIDTVGDMQIEIKRRVQRIDQPQHGMHDRRVGLDIIAVEIDVLRRCTPALLYRATLVRTAEARSALVPINIEDRHEHEVRLIEKVVLPPQRDIAQQHHACIRAIALPRMDARLRQHGWLRIIEIGGSGDARLPGRDDGNQIAAQRGLPDRHQVNQR